jgi:surface protein
MKKYYSKFLLVNALILIILFSAFTSQAQFITKWQTTTPGESITIPTTGGGYNYSVDWGDASSSTGQTGDATHNYTTAGTYTVSITGAFPQIFFNNAGDKDKILEISQWGTNAWTSMNNAFYGCTNLNITATDAPILSGVMDMSGMFNSCSSLNPTGAAGIALNTWNTASVNNMKKLFDGDTSFNQNIGNWNTGAVTNFFGMFDGAAIFNQNLGSWNTGAATDMGAMFFEAHSFNGDISNWNTGAVTSMRAMFEEATSFNQNIANWNTGAVTTMKGMFEHADSFNQNIANWNTANVTDMSFLFNWAITFNQNIGAWQTGAVTNMSNMFSEATDFNQDIGSWQTGAVTDMTDLFSAATNFNQDIGNWNTANVIIMTNMFTLASSFNQNIGNWNTGSVQTMYSMFRSATSFNQNIGNWNITSVVDMTEMLDNSGLNNTNYDNTLIGWAAQSTPQMNVLLNAAGLNYCAGAAARNTLTTTYNWTITGDAQDCSSPFITQWQTTAPGESITIPTTGGGYNYSVDWGDGTMVSTAQTGDATHNYTTAGTYTVSITGAFPRIYFNNTGDKDKIIEISHWGSNAWTSMAFAFVGCTNLNITATDAPLLSGVTDMSEMFRSCSSLSPTGAAGIALNTWNTASVTNMEHLFDGATIFNQNIGGWNTGVVTNFYAMFYNAIAFSQNIGSWNTSDVTNMGFMFSGASSFNSDISGWKTGAVTDMDAMFQNATSFNQNIANWNTANVINMRDMFYEANSFNQNLTNWNTANVTDMSAMFLDANSFNQNIGSWNTGAVADMSFMFDGATSFNQNLGNWNITAVTDMSSMLDNSGMSRLFYDKILDGWNAQTVQNAVPLGALNVRYCNGVASRDNLINNHGWIIRGDINDCSVLPIDLVSFTAQKSGNDAVKINWTSGVESNVASMSVEKSGDGTNWQSIYTCAPKGSNSNYEARDNNPVSGTNYYRLLTTDLDGSQRYSDVRSVNFSNSLLPNVYPNPTSGSITINNIKTGDVIILTDVSGREMLKSKATAETQMLDVHSLAQGLYFMSIIRDGKVVMNDKITKM